MYIFCPLTKTFNVEESRPLFFSHENIQPIEILILEFIHNTNHNHKLFNLIQHTNHEFSVGTEELNTKKAFQLLWPLLLGSTPTSEQIREIPFNHPTTTDRPPYWVTNKYPHYEPNLVNKPVDVSFDTTLSKSPETLSLP